MDETVVAVEASPLNPEQRARVEALRAARHVIGSSKLFGSDLNTSVFDLITVARYILAGTDPSDGFVEADDEPEDAEARYVSGTSLDVP